MAGNKPPRSRSTNEMLPPSVTSERHAGVEGGHPSGDDAPPYVVVARRFRPRAFSELVGQDHIGQALRVAIESDRVGHAYLFTGARGTGKTSTARIFAKCLNAPGGPSVEPPQDSDIALAIDAGSDIDVLEIDAASNRGIDEIRALRSGVGMRPSRGQYKIYIIDEVHMLTKEAFNALLKTLEEPPGHVKFILCTTDPEKIPITVRSRCQRFDFLPIKSQEIIVRLQEIVAAEGAQADPSALRMLARRAAGSMRDSQSLLEQVLSYSGGAITLDAVHAMLGTADDQRIAAIAAQIFERKPASALQLLDEMVAGGVDAGQLAEQLLGYFRDLLMATVDAGADLLRFVAADDYPRLQAIGRSLGSAQLLAIVGLLDQSIVRMRQSLHSRVLLEVALVQISSLPDLQQLRDVLEGYALPEEEKKKPLMPTAATALGGSVATVERPPGGRAAATVAATESPAAPIAIASSVANRSDEAARSESSDPRPYPSPAIVLPSVERRSPIDRTNERAPPIVSESGDAPAHSQSVPPVDLVMEAVVGDGEQEPPARSVDSPGDMSHRLQAAWQAMLDQLEDLTADAARPAQQVQWIDPGRVRVVFPADKQLSLRSCERPDRRARLERELAQRLEAPISLEFTALPATQAVMPASPRLGTHQRLQERRAIEADPLVRRVMELFNAEITRVDTAHPGPAGGAGAAAAPKAAPRPADPVASVRTSAAEEVASDDDDV